MNTLKLTALACAVALTGTLTRSLHPPPLIPNPHRLPGTAHQHLSQQQPQREQLQLTCAVPWNHLRRSKYVSE